jgi:hypothetical protein
MRRKLLFPLLFLSIFCLAGCVSAPEYSDPMTELKAKKSPLKGVDLGIVYTENALKGFEYIDQNKKLASWAYPFAAGDVGSEKVTSKLQEAVGKRFKSAARFSSVEEALKTEVDMILSFDLQCTLGQRTFNTTSVDVTGTFMDRNQEVIDSVRGSGKAMAWPWTYGFRTVLKGAFDEFAEHLDQSSKMKAFADRVTVPAYAGEIIRGGTPAGERQARGYYDKSWAVVIGINRYDVWPPLEYAVNDALQVEKKLKEVGFDEVMEILDKEATRARILTLLGSELPRKVGKEDRVVIFFAGHGQTESLAGGGEQGYIIPVDGDIVNYFTTAISMSQVRELSQRIPAKHLLYVMDACYSGHGFHRAGGLSPAINGYVEKITAMRSVQMITAGGKNEQVMEDRGQGVFTQYFLRGLDGEADRDLDGVVTVSELGAYLMPQVSRASNNLQTPQYGRLDGEGEVVFMVPAQKGDAA